MGKGGVIDLYFWLRQEGGWPSKISLHYKDRMQLIYKGGYENEVLLASGTNQQLNLCKIA